MSFMLYIAPSKMSVVKVVSFFIKRSDANINRSFIIIYFFRLISNDKYNKKWQYIIEMVYFEFILNISAILIYRNKQPFFKKKKSY